MSCVSTEFSSVCKSQEMKHCPYWGQGSTLEDLMLWILLEERGTESRHVGGSAGWWRTGQVCACMEESPLAKEEESSRQRDLIVQRTRATDNI